MTTVRTAHLTEDQFTECVLLHAGTESAKHLAECVFCREELAKFHESMSAFKEASLAWSDARPQPSLRAAAAAKARRTVLVPVAWALAAAAVVVAGAPMWQHARHAGGSEAAAVIAADSEAQIAQDNRLLESVNVALAAADPSPFSEYQLRDAAQMPDKAWVESRNP